MGLLRHVIFLSLFLRLASDLPVFLFVLETFGMQVQDSGIEEKNLISIQFRVVVREGRKLITELRVILYSNTENVRARTRMGKLNRPSGAANRKAKAIKDGKDKKLLASIPKLDAFGFGKKAETHTDDSSLNGGSGPAQMLVSTSLK